MTSHFDVVWPFADEKFKQYLLENPDGAQVTISRAGLFGLQVLLDPLTSVQREQQ